MSPENDGGNDGTRLVPQEHGGALWSNGPPPGRAAAGPGRPPSVVKEALRKDFDERRQILADIADGTVYLRLVGKCEECGHEGEPLSNAEIVKLVPSVADRLKALDVMGKYSDLTDAKKIDSGLIQRLALVTRPYLSDNADHNALEEEWLGVIADWLG